MSVHPFRVQSGEWRDYIDFSKVENGDIGLDKKRSLRFSFISTSFNLVLVPILVCVPKKNKI